MGKSFADWKKHLYDDDGVTPLRSIISCREARASYVKAKSYNHRTWTRNMPDNRMRGHKVDWHRIAMSLTIGFIAIMPFAANADVTPQIERVWLMTHTNSIYNVDIDSEIDYFLAVKWSDGAENCTVSLLFDQNENEGNFTIPAIYNGVNCRRFSLRKLDTTALYFTLRLSQNGETVADYALEKMNNAWFWKGEDDADYKKVESCIDEQAYYLKYHPREYGGPYFVTGIYWQYIHGKKCLVFKCDKDWYRECGDSASLTVHYYEYANGGGWKTVSMDNRVDSCCCLYITEEWLKAKGYRNLSSVMLSSAYGSKDAIRFEYNDGALSYRNAATDLINEYHQPYALPNAVNLTMDGSTVRVRLTGAELCTFQVQTSADLHEWQTIHDAVDSPASARFFRVVVLDDPSSPQYGADLADADNSHSLDRRKGNISVEFEIDADAPVSLLATPDYEIYTLHADKYYCNYYRIYAD